MKAVNLTSQPIELDPENGPGMLAPALPEYDGAHERELTTTTDRERALAVAGLIGLYDSKGREQHPDPPDPPASTTEGEAA